MVTHNLVYDKEGNGTMLTFEDAVTLTHLLVEYFNTDMGKNILGEIGQHFNLKLKDSFDITIGKISKNCPDCSGCHQESCILGCTKTPGYDMCYWDEALKKIVGTGLVVHETAHVVYGQAYENPLSENSKGYFEQSEQYAQYVENKFTDSLVYCLECQDFVIDLKRLSTRFSSVMDNQVVSGIITGIGFGIGSFAAALLIGVLKTKSETVRKITT